MGKEKFRLVTDGYDIENVAFRDRHEAIDYAKKVEKCGHHPHLYVLDKEGLWVEIKIIE